MSIVVSADSHVVEPGDLWQLRLPRRFRSQAPRRVDNGDGTHDFWVEGVNGPVLVHKSDQTLVDDASHREDGRYDPCARLCALDADGVWAEVLYPSTGLWAFSIADPELAMASARVYNDWLAETFAGCPRFAGGAMLPVHDVSASVAEIERVAALGLRSLMLPMSPPPSRPYHHRDYEPLWSAADAWGLPLTFHVSTGGAIDSAQRFDAGSDPAALIGGLISVALPAPVVVSHLVGSGVFDRHPDLHMVLVETGIGWLAWVLDELDRTAELLREKAPIRERPSHYVRRNVHATFMEDRVGLMNRAVTGIESLLWGTDYPHHEGTWPHTQETLDRLFAELPPADRDAIVGGTTARIFRIEPPPVPLSRAHGSGSRR